MLKIIRTGSPQTREVLTLEGKVVGRWVQELRTVSADALAGSDRRMTLDLKGVSFIDADGVALMQELARRQVTLANCSVFTAEQLGDICSKETESV